MSRRLGRAPRPAPDPLAGKRRCADPRLLVRRWRAADRRRSATRSWSRRRRDAGSRCRAEAGWSTCRRTTSIWAPSARAGRTCCCSSAGPTEVTRRCCWQTPRRSPHARWTGPVVVAGNTDAAQQSMSSFGAAGVPFVVADNVVPQIGVLRPECARAAIREMFLAACDRRQAPLPTSATSPRWSKARPPTSCSRAVELLASGLGPGHPGAGDVVVVDVGGATTDVHSVVEVDPETAALGREVVATVPVNRTVEGDLGMRWSAVPTVEAAADAGLDVPDRAGRRGQARHDDPSLVPASRGRDARRPGHRLGGCGARRTTPCRPSAGGLQPDGPARRAHRHGPARGATCSSAPVACLRHDTGGGLTRSAHRGATGDHVEGGWLVPRSAPDRHRQRLRACRSRAARRASTRSRPTACWRRLRDSARRGRRV